MDYTVAVQDSNFMDRDWIHASGDRKEGIPRSYVVNTEGKLAWTGHPKDLEKVLPQIVNNTWDIKSALEKRVYNKNLKVLDDSLNYDLMNYLGNRYDSNDVGRPDSALIIIDRIIADEPGLKYAPHIAFNTFSALLKTDLQKAYEYGKTAIVTSTYEDPPYDVIYGGIEFYKGKLKLSLELYQLGAEAYQKEIDNIPYPELVNMPERYNKMAEWYWRANKKEKAIAAQTKAIEELKRRKGSSKEDLSLYEAQLKQYKAR